MLIAFLATGCGQNRLDGTQLRQGQAIFARSCSGCHTLVGHDTRAPGGDLAIARLSIADLASFARVMPARLTSAEVDAVAAYIHSVAGRKAGR